MSSGVGGLEGDGDIFNPDNQQAFIKFVHDNTDGLGVHFVMADGVCSYNHFNPYTVKILKIRTCEKFAVITLKFEQGWLYYRVMCPAGENGIANSVDLVWPSLFAQTCLSNNLGLLQ